MQTHLKCVATIHCKTLLPEN